MGHLNTNTLRLRRNTQHFADNIFKHIFFSENVWIFIKLSLKFVPKGPINNTPALVQIMAWHWPGIKPLSEPMIVSLMMYICVARSQWIKMPFCLYRDSYHKDQMLWQSSNFYYENPHTMKDGLYIEMGPMSCSSNPVLPMKKFL